MCLIGRREMPSTSKRIANKMANPAQVVTIKVVMLNTSNNTSFILASIAWMAELRGMYVFTERDMLLSLTLPFIEIRDVIALSIKKVHA